MVGEEDLGGDGPAQVAEVAGHVYEEVVDGEHPDESVCSYDG